MKIMQSAARPSVALCPLFTESVPAGFPSPADDYIDDKLDLNSYLIRHPAATFFVRADGDSMVDAGIHHGDILIVDRALKPVDKSVVIAVLDGELTVKRLRKTNGELLLIPDNGAYEPLRIGAEMNCEIWGVVTTAIHEL
ncbi:MAG: translesion error-prone DNA polymerase V autoproteolytic subunit [Candidatus Latescibacteria bacterium]|nr:translesion error-prone DNA polymerase V autoproteolytic subunit [Candidatus Latescibacterota bacterium]